MNSAASSETDRGRGARFDSSVTTKSRRYPSAAVPAARIEEQFSPSPARQRAHSPQGRTSRMYTRMFFCAKVHPLPASATTPTAKRPGTRGYLGLGMPR